jgi:hypothetical protein
MNRLMGLLGPSLILWLCAVASATVLHVPGQYPTIQAGIDAAGEGDTVLVADGTYTGTGNRDIDFLGKAIVVMSENGPEVTIIDCQGTHEDPHRGFYFTHGEGPNSVVQGFTIRGGYAYGESSQGSGGAIICWNSSPTIVGNSITGNRAELGGGGIFCYESSPQIVANRIAENVLGTYGGGGGICLNYLSAPTIRGNTITGNGAFGGGGIHCGMYCSPDIAANTIAANAARRHGGGISCWVGSLATIMGNTISRNAGGLYGGGIYCYYCSAILMNSVLWADSAISGLEIYLDDYSGSASSITVEFSDVEGGSSAVYVGLNCNLYWGEGNLDDDPMFVLPNSGDYRLLWGSPCIDAGHPDSLDPDGTRSDMGARFFDQDDYMTLYLTPDTMEVSPGEVLGVTYTVINRWAQPEPFWVLTEATLPNGTPFRVMGPDQYALPANHTEQRHLNHIVPGLAPFGMYGYGSRIGVPPSTLYDDDSFAFIVVGP